MPAPSPQGTSRDALTEQLNASFSPAGLRRRRWRRALHTVTWVAVLAGFAGLKRALDFCLAFALLLALSPVFAVVSLLRFGQPLFERTRKVGRWSEPFDELAFAGLPRVVKRLPVLLNILRGEISFVGPRSAAPEELSPRERQARKRYGARPGLICLWWIRKRANIAYATEADVDAEYVESHTVRGDFGIALRAIPALLYGEGVAVTADTVTILDIPVRNLTMTDALDWIVERCRNQTPGQICFVNADCANLACRNPEYMAILHQTELVLADGIGMKLAGKLLGSEIRQNVNGTDMFPRLCETLAGTGIGIYLLGARPGIAALVAKWVAEHYPAAKVYGFRDGYFKPHEEADVIRGIAESGASVLLVAFGAPRQDLWIRRHLAATGVKVAMGVGGLFDFYSGRVPRAPVWMREIGAEWIYRFIQEPRRMWRRYFVGNVVFLWRVLRRRGGKT